MKVIMSPPNPQWLGRFDKESELLRAILGDKGIDIHHIGSTSIPGIHAKPIIDILLVVTELEALDAESDRMRANDYEVMGEYGIPERRYFRKSAPDGSRLVHVHAFQKGSEHILRHLAFRDFMRARPELAKQYSDLKRRLAESHPDDIDAYMDGKDPFIKAMEKRAVKWLTSRAVRR